MCTTLLSAALQVAVLTRIAACTTNMSAGATAQVAPPIGQAQASREAVYFDHDGGNDDFVALVYLLHHRLR